MIWSVSGRSKRQADRPINNAERVEEYRQKGRFISAPSSVPYIAARCEPTTSSFSTMSGVLPVYVVRAAQFVIFFCCPSHSWLCSLYATCVAVATTTLHERIGFVISERIVFVCNPYMLTPRVMIGFGSDQGIYDAVYSWWTLFFFLSFFFKKKAATGLACYIILRKTKLQIPKSWKQKIIKKRE
jgi:hypothetical protein